METGAARLPLSDVPCPLRTREQRHLIPGVTMRVPCGHRVTTLNTVTAPSEERENRENIHAVC